MKSVFHFQHSYYKKVLHTTMRKKIVLKAWTRDWRCDFNHVLFHFISYRHTSHSNTVPFTVWELQPQRLTSANALNQWSPTCLTRRTDSNCHICDGPGEGGVRRRWRKQKCSPMYCRERRKIKTSPHQCEPWACFLKTRWVGARCYVCDWQLQRVSAIQLSPAPFAVSGVLAHFLMTHCLVPVWGLVVGDPCSKQSKMKWEYRYIVTLKAGLITSGFSTEDSQVHINKMLI